MPDENITQPATPTKLPTSAEPGQAAQTPTPVVDVPIPESTPEIIAPEPKPQNYIEQLRALFLEKREIVGNLEMTSGNYDNNGNLVTESIPTITTDFCEIGNYNDVVYLTFIVYSDTYNKNIFDSFQNFPNVKFYPFFNFNNTLYPKDNFNYENFEKEITQDKYFQINFNYKTSETPENLYQEYIKIKNVFAQTNAKIVNQLQVDLTKEVKPEPVVSASVEPKQAESQVIEKVVYTQDPNFIQKLLNKARAKIQERKRKKLDKIMTLFAISPQISSKDVQKLLRTSKRSATRYLDQLEKEQKIIQHGKIGHGVLYTKKP